MVLCTVLHVLLQWAKKCSWVKAKAMEVNHFEDEDWNEETKTIKLILLWMTALSLLGPHGLDSHESVASQDRCSQD